MTGSKYCFLIPAFPLSLVKEMDTTATLCQMLESEYYLRNHVRGNADGQITRWPKQELTGMPSVKAMVLNVVALELVARWWTSKNPSPCVIPIDQLRSEAHYIKKLMSCFFVKSTWNLFKKTPNPCNNETKDSNCLIVDFKNCLWVSLL